ncbi:hypothetical protein BDZ45DRAFT_594275 [Acephala macrosclerotiorum]|nr:hypothetical protein BDZ45DRAFT_594275 [Acephala macrosclerotiorum]
MGGVLLSPLISNSSTNIIEANSVQDHTIGQLCPEGDEYITREHDDAGEEKVTPTGQLNGGREYLCQAFLVLNRGNKLFMLATECAKVLGYRDSYLLFTENRDLYEIIASYEEKEGLMEREILPYLSVGRQIAIVTAKSMFRQFGSKMIVNGRRVRDDYWESKGSEQGFTEEILPGEKKAVVMDLGEATKAEIPGPSNQYLTQANIAGLPFPSSGASEYNKQIGTQSQQVSPIPIVALSSKGNTMNAFDEDDVDMLNFLEPELNPKKRKRNFTNRIKTGCSTCHRRKMKCDKAKPECKSLYNRLDLY